MVLGVSANSGVGRTGTFTNGLVSQLVSLAAPNKACGCDAIDDEAADASAPKAGNPKSPPANPSSAPKSTGAAAATAALGAWRVPLEAVGAGNSPNAAKAPASSSLGNPAKSDEKAAAAAALPAVSVEEKAPKSPHPIGSAATGGWDLDGDACRCCLGPLSLLLGCWSASASTSDRRRCSRRGLGGGRAASSDDSKDRTLVLRPSWAKVRRPCEDVAAGREDCFWWCAAAAAGDGGSSSIGSASLAKDRWLSCLLCCAPGPLPV